MNVIDLNRADGPFGKLSPFYRGLNPKISSGKDYSKIEESSNLLSYVYAGIILNPAIRKTVLDRDPHHVRHDSYYIFDKEVDDIASHSAQRVIERIYKEDGNALKVLLQTGKRPIRYVSKPANTFSKTNILGKALMSHREKMRRILRETLSAKDTMEANRILNETLTAYHHLKGLADKGVNLFERGYQNMRTSALMQQIGGATTSITSIDDLPEILKRVVREHPKYDGILADLVMASFYNENQSIENDKAVVKQAYYNSVLKGDTVTKNKEKMAMESELNSKGKMEDFERRLLWLFKRGIILSDRSNLSDDVKGKLESISAKMRDVPKKSVDDVFKDFRSLPTESEPSITIADLGENGGGGEVVWRDLDLPSSMFTKMYAILYSTFAIVPPPVRKQTPAELRLFGGAPFLPKIDNYKLKVGIPTEEAYQWIDMFDKGPNGAPLVNLLEEKFEMIIDQYCKMITERRCEVALRMIYRDPTSEMSRLLATVGDRSLVLSMESSKMSAFIVSKMDEIRHSPLFQNVVPIPEGYLTAIKKENGMSDIFKGDELGWILSKIDDVMYGMKQFRLYKKHKFDAPLNDDDIKCVLSMYMNCVTCTLDGMSKNRVKKLLSHKDVPSDFCQKYGGLSQKGVTMLWNYALVLHNMFTMLKDDMGIRLSIEKMQKMVEVISHEKQPDVKMAVINLLEIINNHMTKTLSSFMVDKLEVELVCQIIAGSKHRHDEDDDDEDSEYSMEDADLSRLISSKDKTDPIYLMHLTSLRKNIGSTIDRLSQVDVSRINSFASSRYKEESNDDAKIVEEDEKELDDIFNREADSSPTSGGGNVEDEENPMENPKENDDDEDENENDDNNSEDEGADYEEVFDDDELFEDDW
jgi:hypothetical protein